MAAQQINPDLTDEQKRVLLEQGTEAPFSGAFVTHNEQGMYICANCGTPLFASDTKYESDIPGLAGWPSFAAAVDDGAVTLLPDTSHGMDRTEVVCTNCKGHLGHIFDDNSSPTGNHYCINSASLDFKKPEK